AGVRYACGAVCAHRQRIDMTIYLRKRFVSTLSGDCSRESWSLLTCSGEHMNRQLLRQLTIGVLALGPALGSLPVRADESVREGTCAGSQELFPDSNPGPGSLKTLRPKSIPDLATYVRDRRAAIALGKALFWD